MLHDLEALSAPALMIFAPEQTMHFDAPWFPHMQFWNPPSQSCPQLTPHLQQCNELEPALHGDSAQAKTNNKSTCDPAAYTATIIDSMPFSQNPVSPSSKPSPTQSCPPATNVVDTPQNTDMVLPLLIARYMTAQQLPHYAKGDFKLWL
ncbi:hypothetical protein DSO57_1034427 [Entomophthora muscae]|uniref:Uncharacterized protein n=1 Tax=Entomophthora muscae TaxID=34485 RepID=A0ACC2UKI6_9FUNG|nr:hypothetical protein DSO57_1034427 [Entomophthora muscae]